MAARSAPVSAPASAFLYVGLRGWVVALRRDNGEIGWSTRLPRGTNLVPLVVEGGCVFAVSGGEISCLDARTGKRLWHNKLKGFGTGFAMLAGAQDPSTVAAIAAAVAAASASASATAAASASASAS